MTRVSAFSSPLLLGFDQLERLLDQATKATDTYPPYNIERFPARSERPESWRITLAVAGFAASELMVTVEDNQLLVKGQQRDDGERTFMHRGIAARHFSRSFVLAQGMEVTGASLDKGLLNIDLRRITPERVVLRIDVKET